MLGPYRCGRKASRRSLARCRPARAREAWSSCRGGGPFSVIRVRALRLPNPGSRPARPLGPLVLRQWSLAEFVPVGADRVATLRAVGRREDAGPSQAVVRGERSYATARPPPLLAAPWVARGHAQVPRDPRSLTVPGPGQPQGCPAWLGESVEEAFCPRRSFPWRGIRARKKWRRTTRRSRAGCAPSAWACSTPRESWVREPAGIGFSSSWVRSRTRHRRTPGRAVGDPAQRLHAPAWIPAAARRRSFSPADGGSAWMAQHRGPACASFPDDAGCSGWRFCGPDRNDMACASAESPHSADRAAEPRRAPAGDGVSSPS